MNNRGVFLTSNQIAEFVIDISKHRAALAILKDNISLEQRRAVVIHHTHDNRVRMRIDTIEGELNNLDGLFTRVLKEDVSYLEQIKAVLLECQLNDMDAIIVSIDEGSSLHDKMGVPVGTMLKLVRLGDLIEATMRSNHITDTDSSDLPDLFGE